MIKKMRPIISVFLIVSILTAECLFASASDSYEDVTKYSYSVSPILAPFNYAVYVKTDNPDPTSFRLYDYDSRYYTAESAETGESDDESSDTEIPSFELYPDCFSDVLYENRETKRVNGGYIFYCPDQCSDGGELVVQQKIGEGAGVTTIYFSGWDSSTKYSGLFEDTDIKIECDELKSTKGYLAEYANSKGSTLFEKLDAVQSYLSEYAVYPFGVYDDTKPTGSYPCLAASRYYPELSLNTHCENVYVKSDDMLLYRAYPFILDSASFPGIMQRVVQTLEPAAEITDGSSHPYVNVTFNGETKTYGGAGAGDYDDLPLNSVNAFYTFKGDSDDLSKERNLDNYRKMLMDYKSVASEAAQELLDPIDGETYRKTITETGGTFIKILTEGFITGRSYAYVMPNTYGGVKTLSDTWVKGRYINEYEYLYTGCTFEDFPNANILVDDYEYTDKDGEKHVEDVLFYYDESNDNWSAESYYGFTWGDETVPDEFFLSREQVVKMGVDKNGGILPESGLIYDGSAEPGTPFTNVLVQGVSLPESVEVPMGETASIKADIIPNNAGEKYCIWESSDESVVVILNSDDETCQIKGVLEGTATVKVMTFDGRYVGECLVTVGPSEEKPSEPVSETPSEEPTEAPTEKPTEKPTDKPTEAPTEKPTEAPTEAPTEKPTEKPTEVPTEKPTEAPTEPTTKADEKLEFADNSNVNGKIDEENKKVSIVPSASAGITLDEFKEMFKGAVSVAGEKIERVFNGMKFTFNDNEYTFILKGDTSPDGKITAKDARSVLRIAARLDSPDSVTKEAADIDSDGKVSSKEARSILRFAAKLQTKIDG